MGTVRTTNPAPVPTPAQTPLPATSPSLAATTTAITLSWVSPTDATRSLWQVQRSLDGVNWSHLVNKSANATSHADASAIAATSYWYRVKAVNTGVTPNLASAFVGTGVGIQLVVASKPADVTGFTAAWNSGATRHDLAWTLSAGPSVTSQTLTRSTDGTTFSALASLSNSAATYQDSDPPVGTVTYKLTATNTAGDSPGALVTCSRPAPAAVVETLTVPYEPDGRMVPFTVHAQAVGNIGVPAGIRDAPYITWDCGDPTGVYNQSAGHAWNYAHLYEQPGSYTITATITTWDRDPAVRKANATLATKTFTLVANTRTYAYVSASSGNDSNTGLDASVPLRTIAAAMLKFNATTVQGIKLLRGDTFEVTATIRALRPNGDFGNYGAGALPIVLWTGGGGVIFALQATNPILREWDIRTNLPGSDQNGVPLAVYPVAVNVSVIDCTFNNVGYAVQGSAGPTGLYVRGCSSVAQTGYPYPTRGYACFSAGSYLVYQGNNWGRSVNEATWRGGGTYVLIERSTHDRQVPTGIDPTTYKGVLVLAGGSYITVSDLTCPDGSSGGGAGPIRNPAAFANGSRDTVSWLVIERCTLRDYWNFSSGTYHAIMRSCRLNPHSDGVNMTPTAPAPYSTLPNQDSNDVWLIGCTIDFGTATLAHGSTWIGEGTNHGQLNCLVHMPSAIIGPAATSFAWHKSGSAAWLSSNWSGNVYTTPAGRSGTGVGASARFAMGNASIVWKTLAEHNTAVGGDDVEVVQTLDSNGKPSVNTTYANQSGSFVYFDGSDREAVSTVGAVKG